MSHLRSKLLRWFRKHARVLPWRKAPKSVDPLYPKDIPLRRNPYQVWIAEIMLQQTQVATVVPYYQKWMKRFPHLGTLALAPEAEVLKFWAGLGYYNRARNLQKAAQNILASGRYPVSAEDWISLPGIGPYTAGAICSLAFNFPEPILDGNVTRVLSRIHGLAFLPGDGAKQKATYWNLARQWAGGKNPGDVNEALMELGALICTPASPQCLQCPLASDCYANKRGQQNSLPPAKQRPSVETVAGVAAIGIQRGKVLMMVRPQGAFLAGHNLFPLFLNKGGKNWKNEFAKVFSAQKISGIPEKRGAVKHAIMNRRYVLQVFFFQVNASTRGLAKSDSQVKWIPETEIENALTNSLARKIWNLR